MSSELNSRLDLRRRTRRRARLRRALVLACGLVIVGVLGWLVWLSPVLEVRDVEVQGASVLSAEQVVEAAQVPLNTPLASLDGSAIRERVAALAPVADVELHRQWPHTLVIQVTERQLVYQLQTSQGFGWVDAEGTVFTTRGDQSPGVVAVIESDDQRLLADVATVVQALPADVAEQTDRVRAASLDSIVVALVDGRQIVWGSADQSAEKAGLLPTLLAIEGTVYNVSVPSHPAVS